jgi:hypothetical protein
VQNGKACVPAPASVSLQVGVALFTQYPVPAAAAETLVTTSRLGAARIMTDPAATFLSRLNMISPESEATG